MRRIRLTAKYLLPIVIALIVLFQGAGCTLPGISGASPAETTSLNSTGPAAAPSSAGTGQVMQLVPDFVTLIAKARPSVVAITTEFTTYRFRRLFVQEGAGSGWIIDKDGLIVTNNHVIDGASSITVTLENGSTFPAQVVGTDPDNDLAVIKINAGNLLALPVGDSSRLRVGDWVVAIGNSLGMGISATKGIVSALGISLSEPPEETLNDLIQTDAAINPGNSGGPLLNLAGEVIGINSAKIAQVGVEGMGYAISIKEAKPIVDDLVSKIKP